MEIEDGKFTTMPEMPDVQDPTFEIDNQHNTIENMDSYSQQILWNDPAIDLPGGMLVLPSRRGLGFNFGEEVFVQWMKKNHADRLIRAHEVFLEGHQEFFGNRLFSLFSASDYAGRKIQAKILEIDLGKKWENNWRHLEILKDLIPEKKAD